MRIFLIIASILVILLLTAAALLVLFLASPVSYRISARKEGQLSLQGRLCLLFHFVRLSFCLKERRWNVQLGILGFSRDLFSTEEESEAEEIGAEEIEAEEIKIEEIKIEEIKIEEVRSQEEPARLGESAESDDAEVSAKGRRMKKKKIPKEAEEPVSKKAREKQKKTGRFMDGASRLKREFTDNKNRMAVSHLWRECIYILSHLKPDYMKAELSFSMGNPAWTGQAVGVLSLIPVMYQQGIHIDPDFESDEFYIQGNLFLKGHMPFYHAVFCLIRILKDKNIKKLMDKF